MSYDPTIGRFISEDPIAFDGGDADLYRYVGNDPTDYVDPSGLQGTPVTPRPTTVQIPPLPPMNGPRYVPPFPIAPGVPANINQLNFNPSIRAQYLLAWQDSLPNKNHKIKVAHEEGGWIYQACNGTDLKVIRAAPPAEDPDDPTSVTHIDLNNPPAIPGYAPIAAFHTHPFERYPSWPDKDPIYKGQGYYDPMPSTPDQGWARRRGIPNIVISEVGLFCAGPQGRTAPFSGPTGPDGFPITK